MSKYIVNHVTPSSRDEDLDTLIFGLSDPDPLLFSSDPDPTCNNGYIKLLSSSTKYEQKSTNKLKMMYIKSNFMPNYLKYKYFFLFRIKVGSRSGFFYP